MNKALLDRSRPVRRLEFAMKYVLLFLLVFPSLVYADMIAAKENKCLRCHHMTRKMSGPTIQQIAERYALPDVDHLVAEVKKGRKGEELIWGRVKMPPSPAPEAEVRKVIEWMLSH
jgi:cytochrome c